MGWGQGAPKQPKKPKSSQDPEEINYLKEAMALPSAATTTGDFSAPGRQGLSQILTPEFWKAIPKMFKGISPEGFKQIDAQLRSKPLFEQQFDVKAGVFKPSFAEEAGIKLYSPASAPGPHAESIASRWLETGGSIPGFSPVYRNTVGKLVRGTNRAYITFLNHLNANRFEKLMNLASDMAVTAGKTGEARPGIFKQKFTPEEAADMNPYLNMVRAKEIADFVNTATGHGPLKTHILPHRQAEISLESASKKLGYVLFSPGLLASRIRMLNPSTYIMATPFVRKQYLKAGLSTAAAWYAFTEMAKLAGGDDVEVSNDWTNADFGKVRIGNTRMDPGGGFLQFLVAFGRMYEGGYTSSANKQFHEFGKGFQARTQMDNLMTFGVNKLNPVAKFAYDLAAASEYNPFHVGDRATQLFVPLIVQDFNELAKEDPSLMPWMAPISLGMGTQTYSKGESVSKFVNPKNDWLVKGGAGLRAANPFDSIR